VTHLDTSFVVDLLREHKRRRNGPARELLSTLAREPLAISVFACCELEAGAARADRPERERRRISEICGALTVVYPDERFPALYGETLSRLLDAGRTVATMDLLIGCTALAEGARLVTGNRKHFEVIPRLEIQSY
jgi:tRNA(fMet)-specific endonuclease VapC